jgi:hypothetical protein
MVIRSVFQRFLTILVLLVVQAGAFSNLGRTGAAAVLPGLQPPARQAGASGGQSAREETGAAAVPCSWGYYAAGSGPFVPLYSDPEATPIGMLRTGSFYRSTGSLASRGPLDFNGDGKGDLFRIKLRPDGDANGDGRSDLILFRTIFPDQVVSRLVRVLLSNGDGSFSPQPMEQYSVDYTGYYTVNGNNPVADLTGDGRSEVVIGSRAGQSELLLNGPAPAWAFLPLIQR